MSIVTQENIAEMVIICPVCKEPRLFVEDGGIDITRQLSFVCHSKKCDGARRYIKRDLLKIIIDKFKNIAI